MSRRTMATLAALLSLAGITWLCILFLAPGESRLSSEGTARTDVTQSEPEDLEVDGLVVRSEETRAAPVEPVEMTSSYRDSLGILTGRILEADLTPSVELPVCILEIVATRWMVEPTALLGGVSAQPQLEVASDRTDEEGRFRLEGLEPRAFHVLGIDLGGARSTPRIVDQSPQPGEVIDLGDIVLDPYVTFIGRVVNDSGDPVPGARVRATDLPFASLPHQFGLGDFRRGTSIFVELPEQLGQQAAAFNGDSKILLDVPDTLWQFEQLLPIPTTLTDEEGNYRLEGIPQGLLTVYADKVKYAAAMHASQPSGKRPERKLSDLVLRRGARVHGTVTDTDGNPKSGLDVRAGIMPTALSGIPVTALFLQPGGGTNSRGEFELSGLPSGPEAWVALRRHAGQPWTLHGPFHDHARPLLIELGVAEQLLVNLVGPDGDPVVDAELYVAPKATVPGLPPVLSPPMQRLNEIKRIEDGLLQVGGLEKGSYHLVGLAKDYALAELDVEVGDQGGECTLQFETGHYVDVEVVRAGDDEPLSWSFVTVAERGMFERPIDRGRTNEEGLVRLNGMKTGPYTLTIQHPAQASQTVDIDVPSETVKVLLAMGGHLKGRVHKDGAPPGKSLYVMAFPEGREDPTVSPSFSATTPDGDLFMPNLEVGTYGYQLRDRIVGKGAMALFTTMRDDPLAEGKFEIFEGQTTEIDIDIGIGKDGPIGNILGQIFVNGRPAQGIQVSFEGEIRKTVETDETGYFDFENLPAGEGRLTVRSEGQGMMSMNNSLYAEKLNLGPGDSHFVNLDLRTVMVSGSVDGGGLLGGGGPGAFASLSRTGENVGRSQMSQMTNPLTGTFKFEKVPTGDYLLSVRKRGYADYRETLTVANDVHVEVRLQPPSPVDGFLLFPEDFVTAAPEPPADADAEPERRRGRGSRRRPLLVSLVDEEGATGGRGRVDRTEHDFRIDQAKPGRWRAVVKQGEDLVRSEPFDVPVGGVSGLTLSMTRVKKAEDAEQEDGS